jgi:SAM-dependent MidA family methyltransferase
LSIEDVIDERGPLTVAAFMDLALYDPELGYYARAVQRSGRAGDFFTSVDVGPMFGQLLATQIAEMAEHLQSTVDSRQSTVDLVEAGAGNGRLSADILGATRQRHPALYDRIRLHLVEASEEARRAGRDTLGQLADRLVSSSGDLPSSFEGVLIANELLDAMPTHQVVMRGAGLRENYVSRQATGDRRRSADASPRSGGGGQPTRASRLTTIEGPPSTPALEEYLRRAGVVLDTGWRVEINLAAVRWIHEAARRLTRGFIIVIDYGHEARDLYSLTHASGTLTTFARHTMAGPEVEMPRWLERPGEQDLTAHVDFTSVRAAAEDDGLVTLGFMDQTYFLLGLLDETAALSLQQRLALKTLTMPGGLGSTHKVLILGKNVGAPALRGCSFGQRVT